MVTSLDGTIWCRSVGCCVSEASARISKTLERLQQFILLSSSNKTCSIADNIWKLTETRYCVHADVVVVDILVKLLVFHEEKPVEQFGGEIIEGSTEADDV